MMSLDFLTSFSSRTTDPKFDLRGSIEEGISLFSAIKDRTDNLKKSLKSWLSCPEVNEIVLVDWDSRIPLSELLSEFDSSKIVLVTVPHQPKWILSKAFNLAARFTKRNKLCKVDSDYLLSQDFFANHLLRKRTFYTGNWKRARNANEKHLNGFIYLYRSDFFSVCGYNEKINTYGWEDSDLYKRLGKRLLIRRLVNLEKISHIPHDDKQRTINQDISQPEREIQKNRIFSQSFLWKKNDEMASFDTETVAQNHFVCTEKTSTKFPV